MTFVRDMAAAGLAGARAARAEFLESRRRNREPSGFREAFEAAEPVTGWLGRADAHGLYLMVMSAPPGDVVEIGSYLGRSTIVLGYAARARSTVVFAVDPHTGDRSFVEAHGMTGIDTSKTFRANIETARLADVVRTVVARSTDAAAQWERGKSVASLFVDGWHSADAVEADGQAWLPYLAPDGVVAFDDYHYDDVREGLRRLAHEQVLPPFAGTLGKVAFFGGSSTLRSALRRRGTDVRAFQ